MKRIRWFWVGVGWAIVAAAGAWGAPGNGGELPVPAAAESAPSLPSLREQATLRQEWLRLCLRKSCRR